MPLGSHVRRWKPEERDWAEWDLEHPYVPEGHKEGYTHYSPTAPVATVVGDSKVGGRGIAYTQMTDPQQRATSLWEATYPGNILVQGAIRSISEGGNGLTEDDIKRFRSTDDMTGLADFGDRTGNQVKGFIESVLDSGGPTGGTPYTPADIAKDVNASADFMIHGVDNAFPNQDTLYRTVIGPAGDKITDESSSIFKEGSTITLSPQSFTTKQNVAEEMTNYARQLSDNSGSKAYQIQIEKGDAKAFGLPLTGGSTMNEFLTAGKFMIDKVIPGKSGLTAGQKALPQWQQDGLTRDATPTIVKLKQVS